MAVLPTGPGARGPLTDGRVRRGRQGRGDRLAPAAPVANVDVADEPARVPLPSFPNRSLYLYLPYPNAYYTQYGL